MIRVLSIEEAYGELKDLCNCIKNCHNSSLYNYLLVSAYYQILLLCGYSVQELIEEMLFPTALVTDNQEIYKLIKSLRLGENLSALTDAINTLKSIGYLTKNGDIYVYKDIEYPSIINEYMVLMKKKKDVNKNS